jgi:hypothetical protein
VPVAGASVRPVRTAGTTRFHQAQTGTIHRSGTVWHAAGRIRKQRNQNRQSELLVTDGWSHCVMACQVGWVVIACRAEIVSPGQVTTDRRLARASPQLR